MSRALAAKFRKHVIALPPGSRVEWSDMEAWAKANCPKSARQGPDPMWPKWDYLTEECMGLSEQLQKESWLAFQRPDSLDYYYRTDKTESQPWD